MKELYYTAAETEWASNTRIMEGDSTNAVATRKANEALANFTGSTQNIEKIKKYLKNKEKLTPLQVKQLEAGDVLLAKRPEFAIGGMEPVAIDCMRESSVHRFQRSVHEPHQALHVSGVYNLIEDLDGPEVLVKTMGLDDVP